MLARNSPPFASVSLRAANSWLISVALFSYPIVLLTVPGGMNTVFFLTFIWAVGMLVATHWRATPVSARLDGATDPLLSLMRLAYVLAMCSLPLSVLLSQWATGRGGWPTYDAISRFTLSIPIFFALRRIPARILIPALHLGMIAGAFAAAAAVTWWGRDWGSNRLGTGFVNPIHFGDLALTLGVLAVFGLGWARSQNRSLTLAAMLALMAGLYASVVSGSRGGWIALPFFILLAWSELHIRHSARKAALAATALVAAMLAALMISPEINDRMQLIFSNLEAFSKGHDDTSVGVRLQLYRAAWLLFTEHPIFGVGMGGFKEMMTPLEARGVVTELGAFYGRQEVHSEILSRLSQLGIIGFVSILSVYAVPAALFVSRMRKNDGVERIAARMGIALVGGFFIYGLTVETFDLTMTAAFYAYTTAVLLAASHQPPFRAQNVQHPHPHLE